MLVEHVVHDGHRDHHIRLARREIHRAAARRVVHVGRRHAVHVVRRLHVAGRPVHADRQAARRVQGHREGHFTVHLRSAAIGDRHGRRFVVVRDRAGRRAVADHDVVGHLRHQVHGEHFVVLVEHVVGDHHVDRHFRGTRHARFRRHELDHAGADGRVVHVGGRHAPQIVRGFHVPGHRVENDGQAARRIERDREGQHADGLIALHVGDHHRRRIVVVDDGADGEVMVGGNGAEVVVDRHRGRIRSRDKQHEVLVVLVERIGLDGNRYRLLGIAHCPRGRSRIRGHEGDHAARGRVVGVRDRAVVHAHPGRLRRHFLGAPVDDDLLAAGRVQADRELDLAGTLHGLCVGDRRPRRIVVVHDVDRGHAHGRVVVETVAGRVHVDHLSGDLAVGFVEHVVLGLDGELRRRLAGVHRYLHRHLADGRPRLGDGHHHIDLDKMIESLAHAQRIEDAREREHRVRALGHRVHVGGDRDFDVRTQRRRRDRACRCAAACRVHSTHLEHVGRPHNRAVGLHAAIVEPLYDHAPG